jgi:putative membrane protein
MVIHVAGAGGTFPIEVLPKVFQVLYKFMPFNYSMNAVRECIGGFYKYNYWIYLAILLAYVALACINGLLLYKPSMILNKQIEKSKEKSGILI